MERSQFRRDPWLRTSGYHLATWSLVAFVLELRRVSGEGGAAIPAVLVASAVLTSLTHERRVGKMAGKAGEALEARTDVLWWTILAAIALGSATLLLLDRTRWLYTLWTMLAGEGFLLWGIGLRFAWYRALGLVMVSAAMLDVVLMMLGVEAPVRLVVLGVALPAAGFVTNRRHLWFRDSE